MGQPAARVGDSTNHGGVISGPGVPMVLIGGMPAAVMGDQHVCPMLNPGVPPPPHVGGPIIATGVMVLIGGKPAARVTDQAICVGPPAQIIMGCMTVLIGDGGGGGCGAGQAGSGQPSKEKSELVAGESHYLDVKFQDKGGKPIAGVGYTLTGPDKTSTEGTLTGQIKRGGVKQGNYDIDLKAVIKAAWSSPSARVGDTIKLLSEVVGVKSGEPATVDIFIRDASFADHLLTTITTKVDNGKIEIDWKLEVDSKYIGIQKDKLDQGGYSSPSFYFIVKTAGIGSRSGLLDLRDYIELRLKDHNGQPLANKKYQLILSNGAIREGTLDGNGYAKIEQIPPGPVKLKLDPRK